MHIKIEYFYDNSDCDTCGVSYAEGFVITMGEKVIELEPIAHCFDGQSYQVEDCLKTILKELGHTVEICD